ncbi:hypothetical protein FRB95_007767 [Tulasnella sp. JGI-2019a]|nr:hypothetical protein FRB95_007767 [Tulasnella sp. JGI-2019a]
MLFNAALLLILPAAFVSPIYGASVRPGHLVTSLPTSTTVPPTRTAGPVLRPRTTEPPHCDLQLHHRKRSLDDFTNAFKQITRITDIKSITKITDVWSTVTHGVKSVFSVVTDGVKSIYTDITSEAKAIATAVSQAAMAVESGAVMSIDHIKYDTLPVLESIGGVVTSTLNIVMDPVMKVVAPIIKPFLGMIPGESDFADKVKNVPIIGNILHNPSTLPPPPAKPNYQCQIAGGGPGMYTQQQMDSFKSTTKAGMTAFTEAIQRSSFCSNKNLSDTEAAFFNSAFDTIPILEPDDSGCMSKTDMTNYLYMMCTMPTPDARQAFIQFVESFPNCSQDEVSAVVTQHAILANGLRPASCNPPPVPPPDMKDVILGLQNCTIPGGGPGMFSPDDLATYRDLFSAGISPFRLMMMRAQLCTMTTASDSEAAILNHAINHANITHPPAGCMMDTDWLMFENMLNAECMSQRSVFISLLTNFPGSSKAEVAHFNATIEGLGCQQPSACPAPTILCRPTPPPVRQVPATPTFPTIHQMQTCSLTGGGAGVFTATQLANFKTALPVGMSPFKLIMT